MSSDSLRRLTVRKLNCLTTVLALACLVLLGHPDTLGAQTLTLNPNPLVIQISGPGASAGPFQVTAFSSGGAVTSLCACTINNTGSGNWLSTSGSSNNNTFSVSVGGTAALSPNTNYSGTVQV